MFVGQISVLLAVEEHQARQFCRITLPLWLYLGRELLLELTFEVEVIVSCLQFHRLCKEFCFGLFPCRTAEQARLTAGPWQ